MTKIDPNRLPRLIALTGAIGAGKSETAKCLRQGYDYTIRSFATPIKEYLSALGVPRESLYGTPEQKAAPIPEFGSLSGREMMVEIGTWTGRFMGPSVFARALMADIAARPWMRRVVIDDLRFPADYEAVRTAGGVVWCVSRGGDDLPILFPVNGVIVNDGDVPQLYERVAALLR